MHVRLLVIDFLQELTINSGQVDVQSIRKTDTKIKATISQRTLTEPVPDERHRLLKY